MKLAYYDDYTLGVIENDAIIDVSAAVSGTGASNPQGQIEAVISGWDTYGARIAEAAQGQAGTPLSSVSLRAPLPRPGQLLCLAGNYIEPDHPTKETFNAFLKSNTSVMGQDAVVELPDTDASVFHFEPELAIVIGKRASKLSADEALDHIFGYTQFIDVSARGLPGGFFLGKSWHTFGPMGPALVTADEVGDANDLPAKMWINGQPQARLLHRRDGPAHPRTPGRSDRRGHPRARRRGLDGHAPLRPQSRPGRRQPAPEYRQAGPRADHYLRG